jgi:two-component system cell cycle response regulator DivK
MSHALIIDDNAKNANVLATMLNQEQVTSTQLLNPYDLDTVLDTLREIAVVFLDLEMPGIDGYDVLKKLKANERFNAIPIIAYTVHISEIHAALQSGFNGFLGKPLNADKFPQQIARILRGEPVWETM